MKLTCLTAICLLLTGLVVSGQEQQQRILRRVIKSTPTSNSLGRIRQVTIRSAAASTSENGAVAEISSKEAANFGQRSANETVVSQQQATSSGATKSSTKQQTTQAPTKQSTSSTTSSPATSSSTTTTTSTTTTSSPERQQETATKQRKASDRQQSAPQEVELLASAPSSWQTMTAVEAPAAMLIATGVRSSSAQSSDLSQSSSNLHASASDQEGDFLRSPSATKGGSYAKQQQQSFFYPQPAPQQTKGGKTSSQGTKTHWYQSTTPRPAPIIQQEQHYEQQQAEQYVEQQAEYNAAPLGQAEPFAFDFNTQDSRGNGQYRKEESDKNGVVRGSYGYTDANGIYRHVEYVADQNGFRANIKSNEPGLIGETQPASIQMDGGNNNNNNQRLSASNNNNEERQFASGSNNLEATSADIALAPPDFESSHKSERIRAPRNFRN